MAFTKQSKKRAKETNFSDFTKTTKSCYSGELCRKLCGEGDMLGVGKGM